jgi:hypothetical protein
LHGVQEVEGSNPFAPTHKTADHERSAVRYFIAQANLRQSDST